MPERIFRVAGDSGQLARILVTLADRDGEPITEGSVTLRASGLFEGDMSHDTGGTWVYDPVVGDLSSAGRFDLEVAVDGITLPAATPHLLVVRDPADSPAEDGS